MDLRLWESALPERFTFYHLGEVVVRPHAGSVPDSWADTVTVAFTFDGEARGLILTVFGRTLDISAYTELGNILASQAADRLSKALDGPVRISPPKLLSEGALRGLIAQNPGIIHRSYTHVHGRTLVPVETFIIPIPTEGVGNA